MEQDVKERIEKCKKQLEKAIRSSTDDYIYGKDHASWETIEKSETRYGRYMVRAWSSSSLVDLTYVCDALKYQDTGDTVASFAKEYYTIEQMAALMIMAIDMLEKTE